jgi:hypothetical protein
MSMPKISLAVLLQHIQQTDGQRRIISDTAGWSPELLQNVKVPKTSLNNDHTTNSHFSNSTLIEEEINNTRNTLRQIQKDYLIEEEKNNIKLDQLESQSHSQSIFDDWNVDIKKIQTNPLNQIASTFHTNDVIKQYTNKYSADNLKNKYLNFNKDDILGSNLDDETSSQIWNVLSPSVSQFKYPQSFVPGNKDTGAHKKKSTSGDGVEFDCTDVTVPWTVGKKIWCCKHEGQGCETHGTLHAGCLNDEDCSNTLFPLCLQNQCHKSGKKIMSSILSTICN